MVPTARRWLEEEQTDPQGSSPPPLWSPICQWTLALPFPPLPKTKQATVKGSSSLFNIKTAKHQKGS